MSRDQNAGRNQSVGIINSSFERVEEFKLQAQTRLESCLSLQPGHHSNLTAPNLQHRAKQERYDQCGNQHHSRELLMMGTEARNMLSL